MYPALFTTEEVLIPFFGVSLEVAHIYLYHITSIIMLITVPVSIFPYRSELIGI